MAVNEKQQKLVPEDEYRKRSFSGQRLTSWPIQYRKLPSQVATLTPQEVFLLDRGSLNLDIPEHLYKDSFYRLSLVCPVSRLD